MSRQQRDPQAPINVEEDSVAKNWHKQGQALSHPASSHDNKKQNQTLNHSPELAHESDKRIAPDSLPFSNDFTSTSTSAPTVKANTTFVLDKTYLNGRCWTPESLKAHFGPHPHHDSPISSTQCSSRPASEYTREQNPPAHDCTKQGHQPRIVHHTHLPPYLAEVGRLDTTAKLPNISWLPVFPSRDTAAMTRIPTTTDTAATAAATTTGTVATTNTAAVTSLVVCDACGQSLPSVPPKVAYRGGQTQVIRYNHQVFRRDFVRARQAPHRIREMARMAEEKNESKAGEE